ncbi:unnamed protein product [Pieris brassicae]|uniref:Retrotransposon gag domain-containing protein n=1 Tax=Pieris brassicae TaxID=7116 RepID=A0A9P0WTD1_PIEBR|nr:unnamed protein product [Pieris brassicae]
MTTQAETVSRRTKKEDNEDKMDLNILLKFIKPFDGSGEKLIPFLNNCGNAYDLASDSKRSVLLKYILSRLEGKAESACAIKEFESLEQLSEFLNTQFGEKKHYSALLSDLQNCNQNNDSVNEFALRVESCLSKLLMEVNLSQKIKKSKLAGRIAAMQDLALHHFVIGLKPQLSTIVRCRDPETLNDAINFAIPEEKIMEASRKRYNNPQSHGPLNKNNYLRPNYQFRDRYQNKPTLAYERTPNNIPEYRIPDEITDENNEEGIDTVDHLNLSQTRGNPNPKAPLHGCHIINQRDDIMTRSSVSTITKCPTKSYASAAKFGLPNSTVNTNTQHSTTTSSNSKDTPTVFEVTSNAIKRSLPYVLLQTNVSEIPIKFLIDSGSSVSLMRQSCIQKKLFFEPPKILLKGINSNSEATKTLGQFPLKFFLSNKQNISFDFHPVDDVNLPYDAIIGNDFLNDLEVFV